ncbi:MAG: Gfo/Idh/MocA family oxidoreductase [Candidatus Parcubacteria bacterium]|nr:Gfo/Idh/MocA family oxidoreductase [Candidatus Parcubacteria bacterium]
MAEQKKIYKAAVIGCGKIGVEEGLSGKKARPATHAGAYKNHPRIELAGLADTNPVRLRVASRYFPGVPLFKSAESLLESIKPDIVSIATDTRSHAALTKLAAKYGIPAIVCEKPIAAAIKEARESIIACKKSGSLLFINHNLRFDPIFKEVKENIEKGKYGKIIQATVYYYNGLFNNGTHWIDILRFFFGEVEWVFAAENKATEKKSLKNDLSADVLFRFKNGTTAVWQSLPPDYGFSEMYLLGEKGGLFFRDNAFRLEYRPLVAHKYFKGFHQLRQKPKIRGKMRSFRMQMADHVVKCLDGKEKPISRGEDGLADLKVLFAMKESVRTGKIIRLKK